MKVSVIVPIYNVEKYLRTCLDSLINQSYSNLEILLIDDGSLDNSLIIAKEYQKKDDRIKVYSKKNGGLSDARNYGMLKASGDFYFFLDSDDYLELDSFEVLVAKQAENDADIVVCDMVYEYEDRKVFSSGGVFSSVNPSNDLTSLFINNSACNKLFRKDLFENCIFPKGLWYEDLATIPIIISKAKLMVKLDKVLYHYLQRGNSITKSSDIRVLDIYLALDRVKKEIPFQIDEIIKEEYLMNAFYLTMLRISKFKDNKQDYYHKNLKELDDRYPFWYQSPLIKKLTFKQRILFFLASKKQFKLIDRLFK